MDQTQLVQSLSESAPQFAWLLGAGASQSAGLPTAWDVMWDLKRRHYNQQENQQITPNDVQNAAVQQKLNDYMEAQGFPPPGDLPRDCFELRFKTDQEWAALREAERRANGAMICTKENSVWAWGHGATIRSAFGAELADVLPSALGDRVDDLASNLYLKGFLEQAMGNALRRGQPLLLRSDRSGSTLIVDRHAAQNSELDGLRTAIGGPLHGQIGGLKTKPTPDHPTSEPVYWAECVHLDLQQIEGSNWLVLSPHVWIWPKWARRDATDFLDRRCGGRFNPKTDKLLSAWIALLLPGGRPGADHSVTAFDGVAGIGNPTFTLNKRTAFSRRPGA